MAGTLVPRTMPAYSISALETACEAPPPRPNTHTHTHESQTTGNSTTLCILWSHHTSLEQEPRERETVHSILTTLIWTSRSPQFLKRCSVPLTWSSSDATLFYQCLICLTDGPRVLWAKLPAGSPASWGHTLLPTATRIRITILPASGRKEQGWGITIITPLDRAGSSLTFCKWFPFIEAAHEWLVVVGCTLDLPDTSTAFWTHLIKQVLNMQLMSASFYSPSSTPGDLSNFKCRSSSTKSSVSQTVRITCIKNLKCRSQGFSPSLLNQNLWKDTKILTSSPG